MHDLKPKFTQANHARALPRWLMHVRCLFSFDVEVTEKLAKVRNRSEEAEAFAFVPGFQPLNAAYIQEVRGQQRSKE